MPPRGSSTSVLSLTSQAASSWRVPRQPPIANYFPRLFLLDKMTADLQQIGQLPDLKNIIFVWVGHLLPTMGSLLIKLMEMGVLPQHIFIAGKCYSTNPAVVEGLRALGVHVIAGREPERLGEFSKAHNADVQNLWEVVQAYRSQHPGQFTKLIIMSDGAAAIEHAPRLDGVNVIAGEQTRHGWYSDSEQESPFRIIDVARSAAKRYIESLFIQKAVIERIKHLLQGIDKNTMEMGVVGCGAIGKALIHYLLAENYKVVVYDSDLDSLRDLPDNSPKLVKASSLKYLMVNSHYIFGCTGQDITAEIDLLNMNGKNKFLFSLSSGNVEFHNLLIKFQSLLEFGKVASVILNPLGNIVIKTNKGTLITLVQGGFPVNFARADTPDSPEQFGFTRALLLAAILQAVQQIGMEYPSSAPKNIMLDPDLQCYVVNTWFASLTEFRNDRQLSELPLDKFNDPNWVANHSEGYELNNSSFAALGRLHPSRAFSKI